MDSIVTDVLKELERADGLHGTALNMPLIDPLIVGAPGCAWRASLLYDLPTAPRARLNYDEAKRAGALDHVRVATEEVAEVVEALAMGDDPISLENAYKETVQAAAMLLKLARAIQYRRNL